MIVDYLRTCYDTEFIPFSDSDVRVGIRWYFAPPGALPLHEHVRFGSGVWATSPIGWSIPGEVSLEARSPWRGTTPRTATGLSAWGDAGAFWSGIPYRPDLPPVKYDPFGMPLALLPANVHPFVSDGGFTLGGTSWFNDVHSLVSAGGFTLGGTSQFSFTHVLNSAGGFALGGTSGFNDVDVFQSSGGFALGGTSQFNDLHVFQSSGGFALGGTSTMGSFHVLTWVKASLSYTQFTGLGGTNGQVTIQAGAARLFIAAAVFKTSTAWTGPITITGSIVSGASTYGSGSLIPPVGNTTFVLWTGENEMVQNTFAANDVRFKVDCGASNLSTLTAGAVDVWILVGQLP